MSYKKEIKYEKPVKYEDKKEAPIQHTQKQDTPAKENFQFSRYGAIGRPTTHKDYVQPEAITVNAIYMMLDPRTMYMHSDPALAMRNYAAPSMKNYSKMPSSGNYKGGKKAA
ncbi:hypothetical protein KY338_04770 [Candidatus Woesearchaeota archaeon]|nr:hypothetical protein [Candidatus Woesearchaeota archaeon]MBW3006219.1 hypothetical protein [Candidatus Woesearchaeota archaeon]